jgi:hypothetical protein
VGVESQWGAMLMNKDDMLILIADWCKIMFINSLPNETMYALKSISDEIDYCRKFINKYYPVLGATHDK